MDKFSSERPSVALVLRGSSARAPSGDSFHAPRGDLASAIASAFASAFARASASASAGMLAGTSAAALAVLVPAGQACAAAAAAGADHGAANIDALQPGLAARVQILAKQGSQRAPEGVHRIEITLGQLDPRLRLAPCQRIEPHLPAGTVLWGRTRIGLRCTQGAKAWNVSLPITVSAYGPAWVAAAPLSAGSVVGTGDLVQAEVDLAEKTSMAITDPGLAIGRTLARAVNTGDTLRQADLKARQWFAAGDEVKLVARGNGFSVGGSGQALTHGNEGQPARVRVESGRILVGMPVGERRVELPL